MALSHGKLKAQLARRLRYYDSVGSTNDSAKEWLIEGAPDGAVVIADEQRRGRGRHGRVWHTPPGVALALSVILKPLDASPAHVNMIGALSVYDLARQIGCDEVAIKWPNDVLIGGKKVSGILVESIWESDRLLGVVLGIGVNVRVKFPSAELLHTAANLEDAARSPLERAELLRQLLELVDSWYAASADQVYVAWRRRLLTLGQRVCSSGIRGLATDVTPEGALRVKCDSGEIRLIHAGDLALADNSEGAG